MVTSVVLVVELVSILAATACGSALPAPALRTAARCAIWPALGWWLSMLVFGGVRARPGDALIVVAVAVVLSCTTTVRNGNSLTASMLSALAAGAACCLLVFTAAIGTYEALPHLVPDTVGGVPQGGLTPGDVVLDNRIESTDPYIPEFLLGPLGGAALLAGIRGARRSIADQGPVSAPTLGKSIG